MAENVERVTKVEAEGRAAGCKGGMRLGETRHRGDCTAPVSLRRARDERSGLSRFVNRVVAAMRVGFAGATLLLDIGDLAARRQLTITTDDAPAGERSKSEESHQTHGPFLRTLSAGVAAKRRVARTLLREANDVPGCR